MPFTLAHPAIIVPLLYKGRRWLSATGLILGSMSPDFEYFLRLRPGGGFGHSVAGIFQLDLPLALILTGLFHGLVKRPLVRSMPVFLRRRFGRFATQRWPLSNLWSPRLLLAIIIGAGSHLVWDGVTHTRGRIAHQLPFLVDTVHNRPLFVWLQYGSSLVGLLIMLWFVWQLPVMQRPPRVSTRQQAIFWLLTAALFSVFLLLFVQYIQYRYPVGYGYLTATAVSSISASVLAVVLTSAFVRLLRHDWPTEQAASSPS
ncbi:DUF4184 family protein [Hymenobacter aerilatus]|uniref:DUF4184 family protein n=1 Tax=Hymenobacter aerilatus TaxID=2932251 RepID=A0A8T9SW02_9BACT|nr:DUF4184 family protein [Hymenobacter aerilatus]UOR05581.1 DUF4184 family protein [Hymenobacter aerilatus]